MGQGVDGICEWDRDWVGVMIGVEGRRWSWNGVWDCDNTWCWHVRSGRGLLIGTRICRVPGSVREDWN
jgi:hypothetical protein